MIAKFVEFFVDRHLLTNLLFIAVLIGGLQAWQSIKKEERPDMTYDVVRITANYPGATPEEVEFFVTRELEEDLRGVDGILRLYSSVSRGTTTVSAELEKGLPNREEVITEIRNAALTTVLPPEVRDKPLVRVFKSSKKAIIDIALIHKKVHLLDIPQRLELQKYAAALELQLVNLPHINSIRRSGYLQQELQVNADPAKLAHYRIPMSSVIDEIRKNHIRTPAGNLEIKDEPSVTINAQLDTVEKLNELYVQAGHLSKAISLKDVAEVRTEFRREKQIIKVNGHESIMFNVVKNSSFGIIESLEAVQKVVNEFKANNLLDANVKLVILDDESYDVRNRLSIIATNGGIGFILILLTLFLFLNKKSGFWVAMGIPFTICATLICSAMLGYTINNVTLAAVIIVMGIVVDDAIVVAENIGRAHSRGLSSHAAAVEGTSMVFMPVLASIATTMVAFVPLFFFSGRFGSFVSYIPPIVFLMLLASLIEALVILPGHMHFEVKKLFKRDTGKKDVTETRPHWFDQYEHRYGDMLTHLLRYRYAVLIGFALLLLGSLLLASQTMKFVLFPHTETREIVLTGSTGKKSDRYDTARITKQLENIIEPWIGKEVVGFRTEIARSRHGGIARENRFRMIIEIVPKEERDKSADDLVALWKPEASKIKGIKKLRIQKSRWGHASGVAIEVLVLENNDKLRDKAAQKIFKVLQTHPALINAEIDAPIKLPEYKVSILRDKAKQHAISPVDIGITFRASLEGEILYELPSGNEHIDLRVSVIDDAKRDIANVLKIPVEHRGEYLAPLSEYVTINKVESPISIERRDTRRVTRVMAGLKPGTDTTPLEVADQLEQGVFREILRSQASTSLDFDGEIADTRESKGDLRNAIILVIFLIFVILAMLYNSLTRPLLIMLAIPFGVVGVILAFWSHGQLLFGFFAAIGTLGMAGVVINDSIIMLSKLDQDYDAKAPESIAEKIARIAQTRLKAVSLTTLTTVAGVMPTAYGLAGYDAMLSEMMLAMAWGLLFGSLITLLLVPCLYYVLQDIQQRMKAIAA